VPQVGQEGAFTAAGADHRLRLECPRLRPRPHRHDRQSHGIYDADAFGISIPPAQLAASLCLPARCTMVISTSFLGVFGIAGRDVRLSSQTGVSDGATISENIATETVLSIYGAQFVGSHSSFRCRATTPRHRDKPARRWSASILDKAVDEGQRCSPRATRAYIRP
jgi:hypothetical protein